MTRGPILPRPQQKSKHSQFSCSLRHETRNLSLSPWAQGPETPVLNPQSPGKLKSSTTPTFKKEQWSPSLGPPS